MGYNNLKIWSVRIMTLNLMHLKMKGFCPLHDEINNFAKAHMPLPLFLGVQVP